MDIIPEPDCAKLLGVKRTGAGLDAYKRLLKHDPCAYCGIAAPRGIYGGHEIDHIHSRFMGGPNHWANYTAACPSCNAVKYNMVLGLLWDLRDLRRGVMPEGGPR